MSPNNQIRHLIIADDDEDDQMLLKEAVEAYSKAILTTVIPDGKQLMHFLTNGNIPELLILDLNMPYKNGTECLMEIRSNDLLKSLPVVILSTSKNIRDIELCYNFGANLFFTKPCSFEALKTLVHSILSVNWCTFKTVSTKQQFAQIAADGCAPGIEEIH